MKSNPTFAALEAYVASCYKYYLSDKVGYAFNRHIAFGAVEFFSRLHPEYQKELFPWWEGWRKKFWED